MKPNEVHALLRKHPVIAAVRSDEAARKAAQSKSPVVFLLGGSILTAEDQVRMLQEAGKKVFLHMDLLEGLGADAAAVQWCAKKICPDGVISTRPKLLKTAEEAGLATVQRMFLMDSVSFERSIKLLRSGAPTMAEVLPGLAPKAIAQLAQSIESPVIAGGMITEIDEVVRALQAGALAVSTGEEKLWSLERQASGRKICAE